MSTTTLLYHAFGLRAFKIISTKIHDGATYFHAEKKTVRCRCQVCRSKKTVKVGMNERTIRLVPIGSRPTFAVLRLQVLRCRDCGAERQDAIEDAQPLRSYSKHFARYVLELARKMTIAAVAETLGVYWHLVKEIVKADLQRQVKRRRFGKVRLIAIDEIAAKKRHKYLTVVTDLETGEVIFVAEGKDAACLKPFFAKLRRARARLIACAIDMGGAYEKAVKDYNSSLPKGVAACAIVTDHFHAVKQMNETIDDIRQDEAARLEQEGRRLLKGQRFLLFMGAEKLGEKPERLAQLKKLLQENETLMQAWMLKESFGLFWRQKSKEAARAFILDWIAQAEQTGSRHLIKMAKMVTKRTEQILNYYDYHISSGPLEGLNNKIKVLKRMAYGYRDMEFFMLRILTIHQTAYHLTGV
jgi:transposase